MKVSTVRRSPSDDEMVAAFEAHPDWLAQGFIDRLGWVTSISTISWHRRRLRPRWTANRPKQGWATMSGEAFWGTVDGCTLERMTR